MRRNLLTIKWHAVNCLSKEMLSYLEDKDVSDIDIEQANKHALALLEQFVNDLGHKHGVSALFDKATRRYRKCG